MAAVPVADPARRHKPRALLEGEIPSPIRAVGDEPDVPPLVQVGPAISWHATPSGRLLNRSFFNPQAFPLLFSTNRLQRSSLHEESPSSLRWASALGLAAAASGTALAAKDVVPSIELHET
jgi:hypothetical protein